TTPRLPLTLAELMGETRRQRTQRVLPALRGGRKWRQHATGDGLGRWHDIAARSLAGGEGGKVFKRADLVGQRLAHGLRSLPRNVRQGLDLLTQPLLLGGQLACGTLRMQPYLGGRRVKLRLKLRKLLGDLARDASEACCELLERPVGLYIGRDLHPLDLSQRTARASLGSFRQLLCQLAGTLLGLSQRVLDRGRSAIHQLAHFLSLACQALERLVELFLPALQRGVDL